MWRGDSTPVCLSIDINGKRELAKYAAVMQLHPKVIAFAAEMRCRVIRGKGHGG